MATSEAVFVEAHRAQLTQIGLPENLWSSVWSQLQQAQVSYDGLQLARLLGDALPRGLEIVRGLSGSLSATCRDWRDNLRGGTAPSGVGAGAARVAHRPG